MPVVEPHIRPGYLASEGAKHTSAAAAFLDLLDNCVAHDGGYGATQVTVRSHTPTPLKGDWNTVEDNGNGMDRSQIEYGILAHGGSELPDGNKNTSYFNTGHVAAMAVLAEDIVIATVPQDQKVGILTRWGKPVNDALLREMRLEHRKVLYAFIRFDMHTGKLVAPSPDEDGGSVDAHTRTLACFGLQQEFYAKKLDMGFPMEDASVDKLFSLFGSLRDSGHGTVMYFTSRKDDAGADVVAPSADGHSVLAGGVPLHEHLARSWWLPPSSQLPWEADIGAPVAATSPPFAVTLQGPAGSTAVDFSAHPWEAAVASGTASPPAQLSFSHKGVHSVVHYQVGWTDDTAAAGMYLYRHPRFAVRLPLPWEMAGEEARLARQFIDSSGPAGFYRAHAPLCSIYGGGADAFPVEKSKLHKMSKLQLRSLLGEGMIVLATAHNFTWKEGKEGFVDNGLYPAVLGPLRRAATQHALTHHRPDLKGMLTKAVVAADASAAHPQARKDASKPKRTAAQRAAAAHELALKTLNTPRQRAPGPRPLDPSKYGQDLPSPTIKPLAKRKLPTPAPAAAGAAGDAAGVAERALKRMRRLLKNAKFVYEAKSEEWDDIKEKGHAAVSAFVSAFLKDMTAALSEKGGASADDGAD